MKKLFTAIILNSLIAAVVAQAPNLISFQAVVRDNSNQPIVNSQVGMKTTILQGSPAGTVVYEELHFPNPQTNANGLVTLQIGSGLPIQGNFGAIQLDQGPYYIKTDSDPTGGTNYTISGTSQFLSVPYALYANKSGEANPVGPASGDLTGSYPNPTIANSTVTNAKIANSAVTASKIGSNAVTTVKIQDGAVTQAKLDPNASLSPSGLAGGDLTGTYPNPTIANSAVTNAKIANNAVTASKIASNAVTTVKIQDGAVTQAKLDPNASLPPSGTAGGDLGGNFPNPTVSGLQGRPVSAAAPAANQVLRWSGSLWTPVDDNNHSHFSNLWTGTAATYSLGTSNNGTGDGIRSFANTSNGLNWASVYAINSGTSPGIYANTGSSGTYSGYFPKSVFVGGNCVGCTMVYMGQNNGTTPLQTGDLVAISSLAPPLVGTTMPMIQVEAVNATNAFAAFGVVQSRGLIEMSEKEGAFLEGINMAPGVAEPGEFVFIVVQGMAQVKVRDGIKAGELIVVGTNGQIQPLAGDTPLYEIGRSLESANPETGLAWVLVGVR